MAKVTYEQARADHEYLWSIAPGYDMTGGYVDQEDLFRLLRSPNKATARNCYVQQIQHWFHAGPEAYAGARGTVPTGDPRVREIMERHDIYLEDCRL